jgi:phosphate starvation-inducible protein PhoH
MSAKRARKSKNFHNNVVQINNYLPEKQKTVKIVPRNKTQESYMLTLAHPKKDVVFGIGPAGTGKTLIAVLTAIKFFKEGIVDKIIVTRPAVSVDEDLGFYLVH